MPAIAAKPADADALPIPPSDHTIPNRVDHAGDLVPRDAWEGKVGPLPFDGETVAVAHAAGLDADTHLPRAGSGVSLSTSSRGPPARATCTARIFAA